MECKLQDGDILVIQPKLSADEAQKYRLPSIERYLQYVQQVRYALVPWERCSNTNRGGSRPRGCPTPRVGLATCGGERRACDSGKMAAQSWLTGVSVPLRCASRLAAAAGAVQAAGAAAAALLVRGGAAAAAAAAAAGVGGRRGARRSGGGRDGRA